MQSMAATNEIRAIFESGGLGGDFGHDREMVVIEEIEMGLGEGDVECANEIKITLAELRRLLVGGARVFY